MTQRAEILRAVSEAATVFDESPCGVRTSFDVIGAVTARNIPLLFRPLDKLWGAFITVNDEECGIIVTTKLGLPAQRFTVAHELGHLLLGHRTSLDETVGFAGRNAPASRPAHEAAADTFASELLAPKRLLLASAKRHGWTRDKLHQPRHVYQLSLRLGISYPAACWALVTSKILTSIEARQLQDTPVKTLKHELAPAGSITNSWADVWALTAADGDTFIEAGSDDLFAVHVEDHASAGYVWASRRRGRRSRSRRRTAAASRSCLRRTIQTGVVRPVQGARRASSRLRTRPAVESRHPGPHQDRRRRARKRT